MKSAVFAVLALGVASVAMYVNAEGPLDAGPPANDEKTGGDTTVWASGRNAFSFAAANLPETERTRFAIGNSFFKRNWVEAPASTTARDGLGPHFLARSCAGCHMHDGRGAPPLHTQRPSERQPVALLLRLSIAGEGDHGGPRPHPLYGDQLNIFAVQGVKPEAQVRMQWQMLHGRFADGTPYTLRKPVYHIEQPGYGPLGNDLLVSPRLAPQLIGAGLLEAIDERDIVANAAQQASLPGPIKGQTNLVWDVFAQRHMVGRFGWKANVATLAHQTAGAFLGDIGITSSRFPHEACTAAQRDCLSAPRGSNAAGPEVTDAILNDVVFYQAVLAPPARRQPLDPQVLRGQRLFAQAQCVVCHRPSYKTGAPPFPGLSSRAVSGQTIWPYTDLLLHDMGDALADGRPDFRASGRQWKTPPLWGIGLLRDVNGHTRLMHDGRADGVLEAILWHGGEAQGSKELVLRMTREERAALVKFVESL